MGLIDLLRVFHFWGKRAPNLCAGRLLKMRELSFDDDEIPKVTVQNSDMPEEMLQEAVEVAFRAIKRYNVDVEIARYIKTTFDDRFKPVWMCVVGKSFGVYVTHQANFFAHFYIGQKAIVLFRSL